MAISAEEARKAIQKVYPTLLKLLPISELVEHFYSLQLGVGGIGKYHTTVFKIKILRYN